MPITTPTSIRIPEPLREAAEQYGRERRWTFGEVARVALEQSAGIPTGTLHVLRHTAATIALSNGVPLHVGAGRLGDRAETLLATYAHLLPHSDELPLKRSPQFSLTNR